MITSSPEQLLQRTARHDGSDRALSEEVQVSTLRETGVDLSHPPIESKPPGGGGDDGTESTCVADQARRLARDASAYVWPLVAYMRTIAEE